MPDLDNITQRAQASNLQSKVDDAINRANSITGGQQKNRTDEEIEEVAKGFEGIFFSLMLKEMKKTVDKAGFMGVAAAERVTGIRRSPVRAEGAA